MNLTVIKHDRGTETVFDRTETRVVSTQFKQASLSGGYSTYFKLVFEVTDEMVDVSNHLTRNDPLDMVLSHQPESFGYYSREPLGSDDKDGVVAAFPTEITRVRGNEHVVTRTSHAIEQIRDVLQAATI